MRERKFTDAEFEVVHDPNRPLNWYPGRKELPDWFKAAAFIGAIIFSLVLAYDKASHGAISGSQAQASAPTAPEAPSAR